MKPILPKYLKLHVEGPAESGSRSADPSARDQARLCSAFREATGWSVSFAAEAGDQRWVDSPESLAGTNRIPFRLKPARKENTAAQIERNKAHRLAASLAGLLHELESARDALWRREAELAAGVPVTAVAQEEEHLAARLEAVLQGGAQAVGCQAAAAYLLDDATTELKLRASWGLSKQRLAAPARPLRGAVADLEALIGQAVVLENTLLLPQWKVPESYPSAICVPISTPSEPLGTLWMFCDHPRGFTDEQTNLVEIIAGRLTSELQRAVLLSECVQNKRLDHQVLKAAEWQDQRLPNIPPLWQDWSVAGQAASTELLRSGFYDWFSPADGQLGTVVGRAEGTAIEAALTSAVLQGALRAHTAHPHSGVQLLSRLNETMWSGSAGGQSADLSYAILSPDTGDAECVTAGNGVALFVTGEGNRRLPSSFPQLGSQPEVEFAASRCRLQPGNVLVLLAGLLADDPGHAVWLAALENLLRPAAPRQVLDQVAQLLCREESAAGEGLVALALQRKPTSSLV